MSDTEETLERLYHDVLIIDGPSSRTIAFTVWDKWQKGYLPNDRAFSRMVKGMFSDGAPHAWQETAVAIMQRAWNWCKSQ